jgi:hypothetical protein
VDELDPIPEVHPELLRTVARSVPRVDSTAPPVEEVDLVVALEKLSREITEHNRHVMAGEPANWSRLADHLAKTTRACRQRVAPELRDIGDSGGR